MLGQKSVGTSLAMKSQGRAQSVTGFPSSCSAFKQAHQLLRINGKGKLSPVEAAGEQPER
jgi:hypothetical protein